MSVGADDYLLKPFSPRELIARVRAMLRRPRITDKAVPAASSPPVMLADVVVDLEARQITRAGTRIELTRTEFDLLATLASRPRAAFTRRQLLDAAWGEGWYGDKHVVDVHIAHLRNKIGDDAASPR